MWRNGSGHASTRSTGPRKHAADGARTVATRKQGTSIKETGTDTSHAGIEQMDRIAARAEWKKQQNMLEGKGAPGGPTLRLRAGPGPGGPRRSAPGPTRGAVPARPAPAAQMATSDDDSDAVASDSDDEGKKTSGAEAGAEATATAGAEAADAGSDAGSEAEQEEEVLELTEEEERLLAEFQKQRLADKMAEAQRKRKAAAQAAAMQKKMKGATGPKKPSK